jgi:hypothetical protein
VRFRSVHTMVRQCPHSPAAKLLTAATGGASMMAVCTSARSCSPGIATACGVFLAEAWRDPCDHAAWKYAVSDAGLKLPTKTLDSIARCFFSATIDIASVERYVRTAHRGPSH